MNTAAIVVVSVLAAASVAAGVSLAMRPSDVPIDSAATVELQRAVLELRREQTTLQSKLDSLGLAAARAVVPEVSERVAAPAMSKDQVAAAVEAYLQQRGGEGGAAVANASDKATFDLEKDFAKLSGANYWGNTALWKKAFAAGRMDEVVKQFEELAKQNPNDIPSQMNLANAYMAYLQMDNSKWQLSMKADSVFDKVLELDNTHWEARFTKAVSYTFYPDFLGKKKDAIKNFEVLVDQQETQPAQPSQAQTYLYLGNLLEQRDPAKAREIWARGARRHPDNAELAKKLDG